MTLLFYSTVDSAARWRAQLERLSRELDIRVWPEIGDPAAKRQRGNTVCIACLDEHEIVTVDMGVLDPACLKMRGEQAVTLIAFGDGGSSKADVHEGMNFAGIHGLPCVFVCENNGYSISVPQRKQMAIADVAMRAHGYGFEGVVVDGADPVAVYRAAQRAAEKARRGDGPTLVEAKCERLYPHTSNDDDTRYRSRDELQAMPQRDPVPLFARWLLEQRVLDQGILDRIGSEVAREVDEGQRLALAAPEPSGEDVMKHIYGT